MSASNWREVMDELARYADTCELFLRNTHPGKAAALGARVLAAKRLLESEAVAQGGGVDVPAMMAQIEKFGRAYCAYARGGNSKDLDEATRIYDGIAALLSAPPAASGWVAVDRHVAKFAAKWLINYAAELRFGHSVGEGEWGKDAADQEAAADYEEVLMLAGELMNAAPPAIANQEPKFCTYPDCNCPFDAPTDKNWCARGLPHKDSANQEPK